MSHHRRPRERAKPGVAFKLNAISNTFAEYRDLAKIAVEQGRRPPTFHETRSLAATLYAEQYGADVAQEILGSKTAKMTSLYRDSRGRKWTEAKFNAGLGILDLFWIALS